jgi:hypothetical protein
MGTRTPRTPLSSLGESAKRVFTRETGRPSTPLPFGSIAGFPVYWVPAFAGTTSYVWGDEKGTHTQW